MVGQRPALNRVLNVLPDGHDCLRATLHEMVVAGRDEMHKIWRQIWNEERAQDLVEYSMLLAAIGLVASGLLLNVGGSVSGIWSSGNTQLTAANTASSGSQAPVGGIAPRGGNNGGGKHGGDHEGHGFD
jgi:Flp pilus assembly pilin Flp